MIFKAHVRRHSQIDHLWRGRNRLGGDIYGNHFRLRGSLQAGRYEAEDIINVDKMLGHHSVVVESFGHLPDDLPVEVSDEITGEVSEAGTDVEEIEEQQPKRRGRKPKEQ